jgi:uncharacterized membrane protein YphA (DoxX/SURF4 family)
MDRKHLATAVMTTARIILGAVFVFASLDKIQNPEGFAQAMMNYKIISSHVWVTLAATIIPWTELVAGFSLIFNIYRRGSAFIILCLLILFIVAVTQGIVRGLDISCGCFTQDPTADKIGSWKLIEDIALVLLSLLSMGRGEPATKSPLSAGIDY